MKKILNNKLFIFLLGVFLTSGLVYAGSILATNIEYDNTNSGINATNVQDAIDKLYSKANNNGGNNLICMFISDQYGGKGQIGSKYVCNPGDGVARNFYILSVDNNNVNLIMEKNLSDEIGSNKIMKWNYAMSFIDDNSIDSIWKNVINVDLPNAQNIADAGGITGWNYNTADTNSKSYFGVNNLTDVSKRKNYAWLYNYTRACSAQDCTNQLSDVNGNPYGYWTKSSVQSDNSYAWGINNHGILSSDSINGNPYGVRPVITISKSQIN